MATVGPRPNSLERESLTMLTEAQLAAELQISTRQVQRCAAAGMPAQPVGARSKRYDLAECRHWLRENHTCLSSQPKPAATKSQSALIVREYTAAFRRAQVRVKPSELKPSCDQPSAETGPRSSQATQD
jgi:hypothetical protein